jgi:hypothetical protein
MRWHLLKVDGRRANQKETILSLSSEHLASCCVLGAFQMFFCNVLVSITWLVGM